MRRVTDWRAGRRVGSLAALFTLAAEAPAAGLQLCGTEIKKPRTSRLVAGLKVQHGDLDGV